MNLYEGVKRIYVVIWALWAALLWGLALTADRQEPFGADALVMGVLLTVVIPGAIWLVVSWILRGFLKKS